jgi:hypothetical protein
MAQRRLFLVIDLPDKRQAKILFQIHEVKIASPFLFQLALSVHMQDRSFGGTANLLVGMQAKLAS